MTHWDGLTSAHADGLPQSILILGATNRLDQIDEAVLRRMPKKFSIPLPSTNQRARIFNLVLKGTKLEDDIDMDFLVRTSSGLSGSEIREACRDAAMVPMVSFCSVDSIPLLRLRKGERAWSANDISAARDAAKKRIVWLPNRQSRSK